MSYLDVLLRKVIQIAGVNMNERKFINFASGVIGADNSATGATDLTILSSAPAHAMSALSVDWSLSSSFTKSLAAGANVITFANQSSGRTIKVRFTGNAGSSTVTWPAAVQWSGGSEPTQTATGTDVYTLFYDGSHTYGSVDQNMS